MTQLKLIQYLPVEPTQQPSLPQLVTTSLSLNRIEHQQKCLDSWRKLGVQMLAIQVEGDVKELKPHFPWLQFKEVPRRHHRYPRVMIADHLRESRDRGVPIILTNADIEVRYNQEDFQKIWVDVPDKTLVFGTRWDYINRLAKKTPAGIDVFRITPEMLSVVGDEGFCIGNCVWDYWLPYALHLQGYSFRSEPHPRLFHQDHLSSWNEHDQIEGIALMRERFGIERDELHLVIKEIKRQAEASGASIYRRKPIEFAPQQPKRKDIPTSESYDKLYSGRGFGYTYSSQKRYIEETLIKRIGIAGRVLDAPCGNGFWSMALRKNGCTVKGLDLSQVGAKKANAIHWNLEDYHPDLRNAYDWVFCRGLTHFHRQDLSGVDRVIPNLLQYAPQVLVTYWTNQSNKDPSGHHFMHTRKALDRVLSKYAKLRSFMVGGMYHAIL